MTEAPPVSVRCKCLGGKAPVAVVDSREVFDLAIDFSRPPEEIAASLTWIFQEAIDTGRWVRRGTRGHPDGTGAWGNKGPRGRLNRRQADAAESPR